MRKIYLLNIALILMFTGCKSKDTSIVETTVGETTSVVVSDETTDQSANETEETSTLIEETTEAITEATKPTTTAKPTTKPTTIAPTTTVAPTTTQKQFVSYDSEETSVVSDFKYGLKKKTTTRTYYYLYSDGSKEAYNTQTYDEYDSTNYAATDAELLQESNALAAANMQYYQEVLSLVNQIRAEVGVQPLTLDTTLCQAATMRSIEMNYSQLFSHTRPNGSSCFSVFDIYSITYYTTGENIAAGYSSPAKVVEGWKNSEGHYKNMINPDFNKLGVGMSNFGIGYGIYWTQLFTN